MAQSQISSDNQLYIVANRQYQSRPARPGKFQQPPFCGICSGRATTEVLYEMEDVVVKQVYCDECVPKAE